MAEQGQGHVALVAEQDAFLRGGLAALLAQKLGFSQVLCAADRAMLGRHLGQSAPQLIVLSQDLVAPDATDALARLHAQHPHARLVVIAEAADDGELLALYRAGAHGVIDRCEADPGELASALRQVCEEGIYVPRRRGELIRPLRSAPDEATIDGLTERQRQVVALLSCGHPNKVIARKLGISPSTVKVHVHAAFRTLGVSNRMAAAAALHAMEAAPSPLHLAH